MGMVNTQMNTAAENAIANVKKMPWQTRMGIAVGSVAGAAALGGGIAGIVESQRPSAENDLVSEQRSSVEQRSVVVEVPVEVEVGAAPPTPASMAAAMSATPVSVLYDGDDASQKASVAVVNETTFMGVTFLLLLLGCIFIGVSGAAYYRKKQRAAAVLTSARPEYEEVSEGEEGEGEYLA
jgi:Ni,Fe-hydrogenase III small subunit